MAGTQGSSVSKTTNENGNGLILYQNFPSYYCQKVVFALHEKKLKYKTHLIDTYRGQQFEPWFVKLNSKCEVPVLKDGVKIIPDSKRIIDYIEDNFSNGNTPRLIPEKGSPQFQTMERMRDLLDNIPIQLVTFGCIFHPTLTGKMNLSPQDIKAKQNVYTVHESLLKEMCKKHKDFKDYYLTKITNLDKIHAMVKDQKQVEKGLLDVEYALKEVEKELVKHEGEKEKWWLCSEKFTIADISLSILLNRLHGLGLMEIFFKDNKLPKVQAYYNRVQQRDSFKKTVSQSSSILKSLCCLDKKEQVYVTFGSVVAILAAAGIATFLISRHK